MHENDYKLLIDALLRKRVELSRRAAAIEVDQRRGRSAVRAERVVELENEEVLDALAAEAIEELGKINRALARAEAGHYGLCIQCGTEIDKARLRAVPWASHCVSCAVRNENRRLR